MQQFFKNAAGSRAKPLSPSADGEILCAILLAHGEKGEKMRQHFEGKRTRPLSLAFPFIKLCLENVSVKYFQQNNKNILISR